MSSSPAADVIGASRSGEIPIVGVIGGGQLARMMAHAAGPLDVSILVLAGHGDEGMGPGAAVVRGDTDDFDTLLEFARRVSVVTFDHELVPVELVRKLEASGVVVRPSSAALELSDKAEFRRRFAGQLKFPPHRLCSTPEEITQFAEVHGWPIVLKAARGGYDGRGVFVVDDPARADEVLANLGPTFPAVVEPLLKIDAEVAVVSVRSPTGERCAYPPVRTRQVDGICHDVVYPCGLAPAVEQRVIEMAAAVAEAVEATGVLAVELFVVAGEVFVNEIAPRPHNSGHWTIDGASVSQFENHIRAVLDLPLGPTDPTHRAVAMVNVIASGADDPRLRLRDALALPDVHVHLYGKSPRPGRKIGHVTVCGSDLDTVVSLARTGSARLGSLTVGEERR